MDVSDIRHAVAFTPLQINHSFHVSSSIVAVAKELRYCIFAIAFGFTAATIVKSVLQSRKSSDS